MQGILPVPSRSLTVINEAAILNGAPYRSHVSDRDWNDWHWQERAAIRSLSGLKSALGISDSLLREALGTEPDPYFDIKITPHFLDHIWNVKNKSGEHHIKPLLRTLLPTAAEYENSYVQTDGMGEDGTGEHRLISSLYEDRGLLFITNHCPVHCRYCFRRRKIDDREHVVPTDDVFEAIDRIRRNPNVRDVIISGGDPLSVSDNRIDEILQALYEIKHVGIVRIDTKFPTVLPQRFTTNLLSVLKERKPLYMNFHFTHPDEISPETMEVCNNLADSGIVLGAYIPLLKGVNDAREILKELFFSLAKLRVKPYYLVQNVTNKWNRHFQVPIQKGLDLIDGLQGEISGVALPTYIVYLPNAGGKVPLQPNYLVRRTEQGYIFRNFENRELLYREPLEYESETPTDLSD